MNQYVRFKYIKRVLSIGTYAATVPVNNRPLLGKGDVYHLTQDWIAGLYEIQTARAAHYLLNPELGWVNHYDGRGMPMSECLTMGGNVAKVKEYSGGFYLLEAVVPTDPMPALADHLLMHKFTCLNIWGKIAPPADGTMEVFYPFIINGSAWIHESKVDVFDVQPDPIWPALLTAPAATYNAIMLKGAIVRQSPGGSKIRVVLADEKVTALSTVKGWVQIGDKRWVEERYIRYL